MKIPTNAKIYESPLSTMWKGEDGIVYSVGTTAARNIQNYKLLFDVYRELSRHGAEKLFVVNDITDVKPLNTEVRLFVEAETSKYVRAMAFVATSTLGAAIGNVFQMLSSTPYPMASFSDHEEAVKWMKEQMKGGMAEDPNTFKAGE